MKLGQEMKGGATCNASASTRKLPAGVAASEVDFGDELWLLYGGKKQGRSGEGQDALEYERVIFVDSTCDSEFNTYFETLCPL